MDTVVNYFLSNFTKGERCSGQNWYHNDVILKQDSMRVLALTGLFFEFPWS